MDEPTSGSPSRQTLSFAQCFGAGCWSGSDIPSKMNHDRQLHGIKLQQSSKYVHVHGVPPCWRLRACQPPTLWALREVERSQVPGAASCTSGSGCQQCTAHRDSIYQMLATSSAPLDSPPARHWLSASWRVYIPAFLSLCGCVRMCACVTRWASFTLALVAGKALRCVCNA